MQQIAFTPTLAKEAPYTATIVRKEATQKIILFVAILACLVLAVSI
jgi:hypothetical protein